MRKRRNQKSESWEGGGCDPLVWGESSRPPSWGDRKKTIPRNELGDLKKRSVRTAFRKDQTSRLGGTRDACEKPKLRFIRYLGLARERSITERSQPTNGEKRDRGLREQVARYLKANLENW